jgi:hypothetical protein
MKRLLKLPFRWLAGGLAVIALGVSAFFHGLDSVPAPPHATTAPPGKVIHAGPWDVTVLGGRIIASMDGLTVATDGDHWFGVAVTVDVTDSEARDDMSDIIGPPHVAGLTSKDPQRVLMARDASSVGYLNPGMPEEIVYLWEQAPNVPVPSTVDVTVYGEKLEPDDLGGDGILTWMDRAPLVTVTAPVVDKRK